MVFRAVGKFFTTYPITRGMLTYAVIWPMSNYTEQIIFEKEEMDYRRIIRYGCWGTFFVAPSLYVWVRLSSRMFPGRSFKVAIKKVMAETVLWAPYGISSFLIGMNYLEGKSLKEIKMELKDKFPDAYKTNLCFWPFVQIINFTFIRESNRVPFIGVFSYLWTIFLSYVQHHQIDEDSYTA